MKPMPPPVAKRHWLFNAVLASALVPVEVWAAVGNSPAGWMLWASLPLAVVSWTGWWMNRCALRLRQRPDYARIAVLEKELLGIEPEPEAPTAFAPRSVRRDRTPTYLRPAELREMLTEMGSPVQFPSEREIDDYVWRKARQQECSHKKTVAVGTYGRPWQRMCPACGLSFDEKPQPPPGRGAGSPTGRGRQS